MSTNILYKNMKGYYSVLQCPRCKKIIFTKEYFPKERRNKVVFQCCECLVNLIWLDLETAKVEIEI